MKSPSLTCHKYALLPLAARREPLGIGKNDLGEGLAQPLPLFPDCPIGSGLRHPPRQSIEDAEPCEGDQVASAIERLGTEMGNDAEHGAD